MKYYFVLLCFFARYANSAGRCMTKGAAYGVANPMYSFDR